MTLKHFQSYWNRKNLCRPLHSHIKTHTHTLTKAEGGMGEIKLRGGVMVSLGTVWGGGGDELFSFPFG